MSIVVGIVRHHDSFAILQRANGVWTFPSGKVEPAESLDEAVIREVMEETGLSIIPAFNLGSRTVGNQNVYYKVCQHLSGELSLMEPQKFLTAQWMTADRVVEITGANLFEPVRRYVLGTTGHMQLTS